MGSSRLSTLRLAVTTTVWLIVPAVGLPSATAAPATDGQGYVDSGARCAAPDVAVVFGSTANSRLAICKSPDGTYEYRGVRLRDGAKLTAPAMLSGGVVYVAENNGISYAVSPSELVISSGAQVIRREPMIDFHKPGAAMPTPAPTLTPESPTTTGPATPLPPPLPAEVGH